MPNTIKFSDNPNEETAFVTQDGGQRNRAVLTAAVDGTIEYPDNPNSTKVFVTVDGVKRRAVAVANISGGGGSGDSHNKGYFADLEALEEAYPTGEAGDYAIVGSTDTVWLWDEDTSAWVDSDTKGQVVSVNSKTGTVVLTAEDVNAVPQYTTMPVASATNAGEIVQFVGTTDASYTNGYFYKSVSKTTYNGTVTEALSRITFDNTHYSLGDFFGGLGIVNYQNIEIFMLYCMGDPTDQDADWAFIVADGNGNALGMPLLKKAEMDAAGFTIDTGSYPPPFQGMISLTGTTTNVWEVIETGNQVLQCANMPYPMPDIVGKVVQYVGTTGKYTNGYFYKCVVVPSEDPDILDTYAWEQTNVQPTPSGLPDQTGQSGKFLTTDGTDASWGTVDALPSQTGYSGRVLGTDGFVAGWVEPEIVQRSTMPQAGADELGNIYQFIGTTDANYTNGYFYKCVTVVSPATATIDTESATVDPTKISIDITTMESKLTSLGYSLDSAHQMLFYDNSGIWLITVDETQVLGGPTPELFGVTYDGTWESGNMLFVNYAPGTSSYAWAQTDVQPAPSGLPDQTGQSGKFLTTDGTTAGWSDKPLVNTSQRYTSALGIGSDSKVETITVTAGGRSLAVGNNSKATTTTSYGSNPNGNTALGSFAEAEGSMSIAIGRMAKAYGTRVIQIGSGTNTDANTFKVANANGNFEIMSADGTIPTARFATDPVADGTYVPTVVVSSGVATRSWAAPSGSGVSSISVTLAAASWSGGSQTVTATGVTASNTVIIGAAPASQAEYTTCGVICTGQGADSLTFTATSTPTNDLSVTVLILA